jgi:hypothetical protein
MAAFSGILRLAQLLGTIFDPGKAMCMFSSNLLPLDAALNDMLIRDA